MHIKKSFKVLSLAAGLAMIAGCASLQQQGSPAAVQELRPGFLAGYLQAESLPILSTLPFWRQMELS